MVTKRWASMPRADSAPDGFFVWEGNTGIGRPFTGKLLSRLQSRPQVMLGNLQVRLPKPAIDSEESVPGIREPVDQRAIGPLAFRLDEEFKNQVFNITEAFAEPLNDFQFVAFHVQLEEFHAFDAQTLEHRIEPEHRHLKGLRLVLPAAFAQREHRTIRQHLVAQFNPAVLRSGGGDE